MGGRGSGGGKRSGGGGGVSSGSSFVQAGSKISVNGDTINMSKRGAYQGVVGDRKTSVSKDGKTSTTTETRLYKSNSGAMYEVTEKTTVRERSVSEAAVYRAAGGSRYRSSGAVMGASSLGDMYQTETKITKVRKRK